MSKSKPATRPLSDRELQRQVSLLSQSIFETAPAIFGDSWTYREVADEAGVSIATVWKFYQAPTPAQRLSTLIRIASTVGLAVSMDQSGYALKVA